MATLAEIDAEIARRSQGFSLADIDAEIAKRQPAQSPSFGDEVLGGLETAGTIISGAVAEPVAGIAGLAATANPFLSDGAGARVVEQTRKNLTFQPRTETGKQDIRAVGEFIEPLTNAIGSVENTLGEGAVNLATDLGASPEVAATAGAIAKSLPTAAAELIGLKGVRGFKRIKGSAPSDAAESILESGRRLEVPVLTTDVVPPTTFIGKFTQSMSEKLGPLGSGNSRSAQQVARQNVVEELAKDFNVELDSDFAGDIVKSLNKETARKLEKASIQRNIAVTKLDEFGNVPNDRTIAAIDEVLAKQAKLGAKSDKAMIKNMEDIKSAVSQDDFGFSVSKNIRTEIIDDLKALSRADDTRATGATQTIKSALDKDMVAFARSVDRESAANWLRSNRAFADELQITKQTELKRILNAGTATPEKVLPILMGGKRSELGRLSSSLSPKGRGAARAAIVKDVLDKSGFFKGDINPDKLATALGNTKTKQAVDVFFKGNSKKQLDGLVDLLNATRRAQAAAVSPATGVQAVPLIGATGIGAGAATDLVATGGVVGSLSAIAKAYESGPVRTMLLKIANRNKRAPIETGLLEGTVVALTSVFQDAKEEREQTE